MSKAISDDRTAGPFVFETIKVSREGAVLFTEISAPPINLEGPELVRDLVSLIQQAEADEAAFKRGFQTREAEMDLAQLVSDLKEHSESQTDDPA